MKLLVFGGTKGIGRELVAQALEAGHQVTQFSRSKPNDIPGAVRTICGDIADEQAVLDAVAGHDAVLCAIGAPAWSKSKIRERGTRNIIRAMHAAKVSRLICVSVLGLGDSAGNLTPFLKYAVIPLYLRRAFSDHKGQEQEVMNSGLDWTIVRPPSLTEGPKTTKYHHGFGPNQAGLKLKISRADVAEFSLRVLANGSYLNQPAGISY